MIINRSFLYKKSGIYKITNIVNGKIYVGSAVNLYDRYFVHFELLKQNKHHSIKLQNSFNKYGKENFIFEVLEFVEKEKLIEREQFYIDTLKPILNILQSAQNSLGYKHSKTTIKKSQQRKKDQAKCIAQIDIKTLEVIQKWDAINQARKSLNISRASIHQSLTRKRQYGKGFIWRYWEERFDVVPIKIHNNRLKLTQ